MKRFPPIRTYLKGRDCDLSDYACLNQINVCGLTDIGEIQADVVSEDMTSIYNIKVKQVFFSHSMMLTLNKHIMRSPGIFKI